MEVAGVEFLAGPVPESGLLALPGICFTELDIATGRVGPFLDHWKRLAKEIQSTRAQIFQQAASKALIGNQLPQIVIAPCGIATSSLQVGAIVGPVLVLSLPFRLDGSVHHVANSRPQTGKPRSDGLKSC